MVKSPERKKNSGIERSRPCQSGARVRRMFQLAGDYLEAFILRSDNRILIDNLAWFEVNRPDPFFYISISDG